MQDKKRYKIVILSVLSIILFFYVIYIIFLVKRIKDIDEQNAFVMDQMRILYELKNDFEANEDSDMVDGEVAMDATAYYSQETEHFSIHTTKKETSKDISIMVEDIFLNLCSDLRYNPSLAKKIKIFIFGNREEYASKIRHAGWSVGKVIYGKNSFYSYEYVNLKGLVYHELTHLLFYHFLKRNYIPEQMRWLSEGLAMYEESRFVKSKLVAILESQVNILKEGKLLSMEDLIRAEALNGNNKFKINTWYAQSYSLVKFMIETQGREKFNAVCLSFSKNNDFNASLKNVYGSSIKDVNDLHSKWIVHLQRQ